MDKPNEPRPIPGTYRRVNPTLVVEGAERALEFYAEVFGATERLRLAGPGEVVAHAVIEIGDSVVMVEDPSPAMGTKLRHRRRLGSTVRRSTSSCTSSTWTTCW